MIRIEKAKTEDAQILAGISSDAFNNDTHYGAPGPGGPPGFDSSVWQRQMMKAGFYYKILSDYRIVGGFIIFKKGSDGMELGRIFIDPEFQNRGIGAEACSFMESSFPEIQRWTLETPKWNIRNHHFYEKMGYVKVGEIPEGDGPAQYMYEKVKLNHPE